MDAPRQAAPRTQVPSSRHGFTIPLGARVVIGVVIGAALGVAFGREPWLGRYGNEDLGMLGLLVIRLLKALAAPLILLAVLDSFLTTAIGARTFGRFVAICFTNISIAMLVGLTILNVFHPGLAWRGRVEHLTGQVVAPAPISAPLPRCPRGGRCAAPGDACRTACVREQAAAASAPIAQHE